MASPVPKVVADEITKPMSTPNLKRVPANEDPRLLTKKDQKNLSMIVRYASRDRHAAAHALILALRHYATEPKRSAAMLFLQAEALRLEDEGAENAA